MQAPNDCPAPGDVVSADRTAPSVPPSTLDFLLPLRNNFRDIIVPRLPQEAKDAILMQKDPKDMTDIERKRTRFAILGAVYGKQSVLGRECILWGCCEHSLVDGRVYTGPGGGGRALGVVQRLRPAPNNVFCASVVDLDPVGSGTFCQIRIRFFPDPGKTGNFIMG